MDPSEAPEAELDDLPLEDITNRAKDRASSGARYSMFVAPEGGTSQLVDAIATRLPNGVVRLNTPVERLERGPEGRWILGLGNAAQESLAVDALIVPKSG